MGPITSDSEKGRRYILTLAGYATRYPQTVSIKNVDTETIAEALS